MRMTIRMCAILFFVLGVIRLSLAQDKGQSTEGRTAAHVSDPSSEDFRPVSMDEIAQYLRNLQEGTQQEGDLAFVSLMRLGPKAGAAVPALIEMLKNGDEPVYKRAAYVLGAIGPGAAEAVPALIELMTTRKDYAAEAVLHAFAGIGPGAAPAVPRIIDLMRNPFSNVLPLSANALGAIGPGAVDAVPELIRRLDNTFPWVTYDPEVSALARIGPGAAPALKEALYGEDPRIAEGAAKALGMICAQSSDAVAILIEALGDKRSHCREAATEGLAIAGPDATTAVPALLKVLEDANSCSCAAAYALGNIGPGAAEAVPKLTEKLNDPNMSLRLAMACSLAGIGQKSDDVIHALVTIVGDEDSFTRNTAAYALSTMGEGAVTPLTDALAAPDVLTRAQAAVALGEMGATAQAAVPMLAKASQSDAPAVRLRAVAALGSVAPERENVKTAIKAACSDKERFVREQAQKILSHAAPAKEDAQGLGSAADPPIPPHHLKREDVVSESKDKSVRRVLFSLVFDETTQSVPLAGMEWEVARGESSEFRRGFNEEKFELTWLEPGKFLHVYWETVPQGNGSYTHESHVLLLKHENAWRQIYRDSFQCHGGGGANDWGGRHHTFAYDRETNALTIEEAETGFSAGPERIPLSVGLPVHDPPIWTWDHTKRTEWRYRVNVEGLEYLDGRHYLDVGKHAFGVNEVAEYVEPRFTKEALARLRFLNPALRAADTCTGSILTSIDVAPHTPWEGDNYGSNE